MKRIRLDPTVQNSITSAIRAGGYPHVAAESFGVPKSVFDDWLARGNGNKARDPYRSFANEVRSALAQARLRAEVETFQEEPKTWLVHGPGRESPERPGWSVSVKAAETAQESRNVLRDREIMDLVRVVVDALSGFPDARAHVAQTVVNLGFEPGILPNSTE